MGQIGEDIRWEAFRSFHEYLEKAFPFLCVFWPLDDSMFLIWNHINYRHATLNLTKGDGALRSMTEAFIDPVSVNTYALVYEWQGSAPELKPILLTAHQGEVI